MGHKNFLVQNVRGLHAGTHQNALRDLVATERLSLVCIQETKLDVISDFIVIIRLLSPDKASGLDGFTALFLQSTWEIIHVDLMESFDTFWHLDTQNFHATNKALMVLLPKSTKVVAIKDLCPISLIQVLGKLFSKL
jgi:hypothetical protein